MNSKDDNNPGGSGVEGPDGETNDRRAPPSSSPEHSNSASLPTFAPRDEDDEGHEAPLPPEMIAASFEDDANKLELIDDDAGAVDSGERMIVVPFEGYAEEEELLDEAEDDEAAPLPPEMIAASFEDDANKIELIDDDAGAVDSGERMIAAPFEGYAEEEELLDEAEDDEAAPPPPGIVAASFEEEPGKPKLIQDDFVASGQDGLVDPRGEAEDDDEAPRPPEMIAAYFERKSYEEEKREEGDDDEEASRPPAMIASSCEHTDNVDQEAKRIFLALIQDDAVAVPQVPEERVPSSHEVEENTRGIMQDIDRLDEIDNNQTPGNATNRVVGHHDTSLLLNQLHYTAINVQDGTFSVSPTHQSGNNSSLVPSSQDPMSIGTNQELIAPPRSGYTDTNNQSLPLLEATLVEDVYDAFPVRHSWLRNNYKAVILGTVLVAIAAIAAVITSFQMQRGPDNSPSTTTVSEIIDEILAAWCT
jgi:hypothetical protein